MPDIADDRAAFQEAMRRAEEASGISRDAEGNEVYADEETPVATPELEGAVPVSASDQPLTPEPVQLPEQTDTSEQQQVAPAVPQTIEELQAELAKERARSEEQKQMIGRQSSEVGQTREQMAALQAQVDAIRAQQQTPQAPPPSVMPVTQELIDRDPATAVQAAFEQKNEPALHHAFEAWKEIDPFTAATWLADRKIEQQRNEFEAKLQAVTEPLAKSAAESDNSRQWKDAFDEVKATRPDFIANAERLLTEVAPQYPAFTEMLQTGDAKAKATALSALYALDKMNDPAAYQEQQQEAANEAAAEAAANLAAAGAVVGQPNAGQPAEVKTTEELEQEAYVARQRSKPSLSRGWTGRS